MVGSYRLLNTDRVHVRFECSRQLGFNISREQVFNAGEKEPARDVRLEWKQSPNGLWYVRSLDEKEVLRDEGNKIWRTHDVMKYTEFEPNAKVDLKMFSEESLQLKPGSQIVDSRPGAKQRVRRVR